MCQDFDAARFAKSAGIPMVMSRLFASPHAKKISADRVKIAQFRE